MTEKEINRQLIAQCKARNRIDLLLTTLCVIAVIGDNLNQTVGLLTLLNCFLIGFLTAQIVRCDGLIAYLRKGN